MASVRKVTKQANNWILQELLTCRHWWNFSCYNTLYSQIR